MAEERGPARQRVALKRYVTIARRVEEEVPPGARMALWRELAAEHGVTVRTLQRRYRRFRQAGSLEGLMPPARRADAGSLRAMPEAVLAAAAQLRREQPARSTRMLILLLEERFPELKGRIGRVTLDRHLRRLGLTRRRLQEAGRVLRRFQSPHRNALWIADFNFPALQWRDGSELSPTVILAILDHATRRLMHFAAHPARDAQAVERGLQEAIAAFGLPGRFYTDNGSELVSRLVLGALGELGIRHVASTVGVPESRGAIERLFRTFEESFLPEMAAKAMVPTLDELNRYLLAWAREGYERSPHDGLAGRTPLQAWEEDRAPLRRAEPVHLSGAFLLRELRRVDKTALISVRGHRYLCADALVGAQVQVRFHPTRPDQPVQLWLQDRFLQMAFPYVPPAEVPRQPPAAPKPQGPGQSALDIFDRQRRQRLEQTLQQALPVVPDGLPFTEAAAAALLERLLDRRLDEQERRWLGETWRRCGGLQAERCDRALTAFISRHGTDQHLLYYLDQIEAAHLRAAREGKS
jgi:transposase InsO family protein